MPFDDDDDDLFGQDFDFVDEDEDEELEAEKPADKPADKAKAASKSDDDSDEEVEESAPAKPKRRGNRRGGKRVSKPRKEEPVEAEGNSGDQAEKEKPAKVEEEPEKVEEEPEKPPAPPTDHVVHVYENGKFKRTINREFTDEDATAFVVEYNRTSAAHCREATAKNRDETPAEAI